MDITAVDEHSHKIKVLLVEDDDGDAKAVKRAFKNAKIANPIVRAIDGLDALEILRGENGKEPLLKPYVILVDLNMPRMTGLQFIEEIRGDSLLKNSIVFVLTTSRKDEDKFAAYDMNVAGYILKETAGEDFLRLTELLDCYWKVVEMPT